MPKYFHVPGQVQMNPPEVWLLIPVICHCSSARGYSLQFCWQEGLCEHFLICFTLLLMGSNKYLIADRASDGERGPPSPTLWAVPVASLWCQDRWSPGPTGQLQCCLGGAMPPSGGHTGRNEQAVQHMRIWKGDRSSLRHNSLKSLRPQPQQRSRQCPPPLLK